MRTDVPTELLWSGDTASLDRILEANVEGGGPGKSESGKKHQKFRDLAESRTNKALESIGRIGNLSNRALYEWEEAEVRKVVKALKDAIADVEARFASPKGKSAVKFRL